MRMAIETIVDLALVIAAIPGKSVNWLIDLLEQGFHHFGIIHAVLGQGDGFDLTAFRVGSDMQLAPGAPFGLAMSSHFPLAFSVDLQTGAVHHNVQVPIDLLRQDHLQVLATPRQSGMVGNRQAHSQHPKDRTHKTFHRPVGQMTFFTVNMIMIACSLYSNWLPQCFSPA